MAKIVVHSESSDWYLIPVDKKREWCDEYMFAEELPEWAEGFVIGHTQVERVNAE